MKLGKTSWLILSVGIFVVIMASLGLARSQQVKEKNQLEEELRVAEMRLNQAQVKQLREQQEELQGQLDEGNVKLVAAKDEMRETVESIDVTDKFFNIAYATDVSIVSISSSSIKSDKLGSIPCSSITVNAIAEGDVADLISYIIKLNQDFTTGTVKTAQITIPDSVERLPNASIVMAIYTYEGE